MGSSKQADPRPSPRTALPHCADFGFGPWRAESEKLVASLNPTYQFKPLRIYGDDVRLLKAHPGQWQVGGGSCSPPRPLRCPPASLSISGNCTPAP